MEPENDPAFSSRATLEGTTMLGFDRRSNPSDFSSVASPPVATVSPP
jgi:hypothetical protein